MGDQDTETPVAEAKTTGRRGRGKAVENNVEDTITKKPPKSRLAQVKEEEKVEASPSKGRGRGRKAKEDDTVTSASPPKRGRKTKKTEESVEISKEEDKPVKRGR